MTRSRSAADRSALQLVIYRILRSEGADGPTGLASLAGATSAEAEAALESLCEMGLVSGGEHGIYAAVSPEAALARLLGRVRMLHEESRLRHTAIEELARQYLVEPVENQADVEVELLTDRSRIRQALADISDLMQDEVASMHPGLLPGGEFLTRGLASDRRLVEAGARARVIYQLRSATVSELADFFREQVKIGVEVRLAPVVPLNMILGDQKLALLPVDPNDQLAGALLVRGPGLVRSYVAMYEYCWYTARPFEPWQGADPELLLNEQQQTVVRLLNDGAKDEHIARKLGVSVRTVSRLVAEVMQVLGAKSRFVAGARASRLGWLD